MKKYLLSLLLPTVVTALPLDPLVDNLRPSATLASKQKAAMRREQGLPVYDWGLGACPFPAPDPIVRAVQDHAGDKAYTPVSGIPALNSAIRRHYDMDDGSVIVATGLKQILFDLQRVFGGEVVLVAPYWVSYAEHSRLLGKTPKIITTTKEADYKLTPAQLESICKEDPSRYRMLIFNHPMNPTGVAYTRDELQALAAVVEKYPMVVAADEVYLRCHHQGITASIADYIPQKTIRLSSLSKEYGCGGYRLGWALFPKELSKLYGAMLSVGSSSYSCASEPMQHGAVTAFSAEAEIADYQKGMRSVLQPLVRKVRDRLLKLQISSPEPQAAWYLWMDFEAYRESLSRRGIGTCEQLVQQLVEEEGLILVPGSAFGMDAKRLLVRASIVDFSGEEALIQQEGWDNRIISGIERLEEWLLGLPAS